MNLAWVVVVGVVGIIVYAEMAGRVAAVSGRPVFDLVRERLGPRFGAGQPRRRRSSSTSSRSPPRSPAWRSPSRWSTSINYLLLIPVAAVLVWLVIWRMPFALMEQVFGLIGLCLLVFAVAVVEDRARTGTSCSSDVGPPARARAARRRSPTRTTRIALFGAAMTPYEVFFFSQRRRRGALDGEGPRREPDQRAHRLPARRPAVAGDHGLRPPACSRRRGHHGRLARQVALPVAARRSARSAWRSCSSASSRRRSVPRWRPRCRRATWWPSTSAGRGASTSRRAGRPRFHLVILLTLVAARAVRPERRRSGEGHRVLDRPVGRRTAADLLPDPRRGQRPELHGRRTPTAGSSTRSRRSTS